MPATSSPAKAARPGTADRGSPAAKPVRYRKQKKEQEPEGVEAHAGAGPEQEKVDYKRLYDVPECPVFRPTAKEFNNPGKYIESISEKVRPFGICKIVPPATWTPPFMIDRKTFTVRTRVQQVNYLDGQARQRLIFVENLCRFWSKRGQELQKLPVIAQAPLDVCRLYHEVRLRGGMAAVVEKKLWSDVARSMDMESSHGSALRTQYIKILLPYEEWKESLGEYRVKTEHGQEEEDEDEELVARRAREEQVREERERKKRERAALYAAAAEEGTRRSTRAKRGEEGEDGEENTVTFETDAGVIAVGSRVSVFWDGDGVSYKGVVVRTCERDGCMVVYDADGETHWEDPQSLRLLGGGGGSGQSLEDGVAECDLESDLPMLESVGGQGALASLDACLGAGAEGSKLIKSLVHRESAPAPQHAGEQGARTGAGKEGGGSGSGGRSVSVGEEVNVVGEFAGDKEMATEVPVESMGQDVAKQACKSEDVANQACKSEGMRAGHDASAGSGYWERDGSGARRWVQASADGDVKQVEVKKEAKAEEVEDGVVSAAAERERSERKMGGRRAGKMGGGGMKDPGGDGGGDEAGAGEDEWGNDDDEYRFGYHDGKTYSLQGFRKMANDFKEAHFARSLKKTSEDDVEEEYWRIISNPETQVSVEYGSELHSTQHGSGFPTYGNALNPLDSKTTSSYCRSGWNLNNLNEFTLLRFVKEDIPGILSPWLYMGMCFSSFCWHNEDHFLYSINYLWEGESKQWYGVPGDQADLFEATLRDYAPQLFELQPDVLFQLVTMIAPSLLRDKGVSVCRARQHAGEFMVTFPRAYHGGFNMGYNVAESCNFALIDWIPWGLLSDRWYRQLGRAQVFSHPGLLVSLAQDDNTVETAMWLLSDLDRYVALEQQGVEALVAGGLTERLRMGRHPAGILTNMLSSNAENEVPNTMLDGKRLCAGRMKMSNMSMQDIRRHRESQSEDECCICLGSTFFFLVRCGACSGQRVSCVAHAERMCTCPLSSKSLEARFADEELARLVSDVRALAERPAVWMREVEALFVHGAPRPGMRTLQGIVAEADGFPRSLSWVRLRQEELKEVLKQGKSWTALAQGILQAVKKGESKSRAKEINVEPSVSITDIQKLVQDAAELKAVPDELETLQGLLASVLKWRERSREAMQPQGAQAGLRHLADTDLQQLLAEGVALRVQIPELRKVQQESDFRAWLASLPPIPGCCSMARVEALVAEADVKKLQGTQVESFRKALNAAETMRSRIQKARGRGTSVAALKSLLQDIVKEKESASTGLVVELEEENVIRNTLDTCEAWSCRCSALLANGLGAGEAPGGDGTGGGDEEVGKERSVGSDEQEGAHNGARRSRPLLKELEQLQDEYQAIGVYIDLWERLRRRIDTAQAWKRKALRIAPLVLLAPSPSADKTDPAANADDRRDDAMVVDVAAEGDEGAAAQAAQSGEDAGARSSSKTAPTDATEAAEAQTLSAGGEQESDAGRKRSMGKRDREREAKKQRKSDAGAAGAAPVGSGRSQTAATAEQVLELLDEESKLRVEVELADTLRSRLVEHAEWCRMARALLSEAPSTDEGFRRMYSAALSRDSQGDKDLDADGKFVYEGRLFTALQAGEALGIALGNEKREILTFLFAAKVGRLLAAGTGKYGVEREQLLEAQAEGAALQVKDDSPILAAINITIQMLEAQGCICGASLQGKGPVLTCVGCHKKYHTICLGLSPSDPRIEAAPNSYMCAPCRRLGKVVEGDDTWTISDPLSLKLPDGWTQAMDPSSGASIFLLRSRDGGVAQAVTLPPASSVPVIPCEPNPCLARAADTAPLCQVCFEPDEMPSDAGASEQDEQRQAEQQRLEALALEAARERGELLRCLECGVCVHMGCYCGPPEDMNPGALMCGPTPFLCRPCEHAVRAPACVLCGLRGGALVPATCGGWAHVSCALWAPPDSGIEFENAGAAKGAAPEGSKSGDGEGVERRVQERVGGKGRAAQRRVKRVAVPEAWRLVQPLGGCGGTGDKDGKDANASTGTRDKRRSSSGGAVAGQCRLCVGAGVGAGGPSGVLVKCQEKGCKLVAHPVCGFENGWYLFKDTQGGQDAGESQEAGGGVGGDRGERGGGDSGKRRGRRDRKKGRSKEERVERLIFCSAHAPREEEEDETLYCICQRRYQEGDWMIECESCKDWFHGQCVGVRESDSEELLADWQCPKCRTPPARADAAEHEHVDGDKVEDKVEDKVDGVKVEDKVDGVAEVEQVGDFGDDEGKKTGGEKGVGNA